jgi:leucyl aminopeptidase (aminopeptidase T)
VNDLWQAVARRAVQGLDVRPGQLILVRDGSARMQVVLEMALALEQAGATPLVELVPGDHLRRLMLAASPDELAHWDRHRAGWLRQVDGILRLQGDDLDQADLPEPALRAWLQATTRLNAIDEERRLPLLLLAVPTEGRARAAGLTLVALEDLLLPSLAASAAQLGQAIRPVLQSVAGGRSMTIRSGPGCQLHLALGDRPWLSDDGVIDAGDRARGAAVSNFPAGSIYTTVMESETQGSLWLPGAIQAQDVVLHFEAGRIVSVEAGAARAQEFDRMLERHSGEPRRISHVGIALNPYLRQPVGWVLVDEHVYGNLFVALGENRYMGGSNASSLNVDFTIPGATLQVDDRLVVEQGQVVVPA